MSSCPDASNENAVLDNSMEHDPAMMEGESEKARIERLGRQRPEKFGSAWQEIGFIFSVTMSQLLTEYFVSGFVVLVPTVTQALDIPATSATWPASAFSLVVSSFLIPFGRLADIYGGFPVYLAGIAWTALWALIGGFSQNELMLDFCRAIQGLGPAAYLPASLNLLGSVYRPGPRKNICFSVYGSMAPLGFFIGIFFAGVAGEYAGWRWYFFIGAILTFMTAIVAYLTIPSDYQERKNNGVKMDWLGSATVVCGLILVVFAITQSSHASNGWATSYIPVTLILGVLILGGAFYVEGCVAEQPLLPFEVFKIKYMRPFVLGLLFAYGTLGIFLLYATL
jgi:MFS family permease